MVAALPTLSPLVVVVVVAVVAVVLLVLPLAVALLVWLPVWFLVLLVLPGVGGMAAASLSSSAGHRLRVARTGR